MLTEERLGRIISIVDAKKTVTVQELMTELGTSESTIRRDLNTLDSDGRLTKVFGGAVAKGVTFSTTDDTIPARENCNHAEKIEIARYAASLIRPDDFVYLDAGTTTNLIIDFIVEKKAVFVTNSFSHAKHLSESGFHTYILGGEIKQPTEAVVGEEAVESLSKYNFTKGFWGTNGASLSTGFSTPDVNEALIKKAAMARTRERFIVCDAGKFSRISCVTFADFGQATVITSKINDDAYTECKNIVEVSK
ncbi:MAG: DeoR/GlpR family DNA-binding transcription regulator [Treponema sp.]|nr:DeoR/GlpR family DNA-binding transcription regulator [Treponema sp.]